jgi:cardiolipin synthase
LKNRDHVLRGAVRRMSALNLPNFLTTLRVLAAPLLAYSLLRGHFGWAFHLFVLAAVTDALDGWIARHFNLMTHYGAVMDPLADKLITLVCVILLTWLGMVPLWLTLAMVVRDTVIVSGAFAYHRLYGEVEIRPTWLGKLHTALAFTLFAGVLANAANIVDVSDWLDGCSLLVLATTLGSLVQYVVLWGRKAARESARRAAPPLS